MPAITVPLLEDKITTWRTWADALTGARRKEFDDFNNRMGLTEHRAWLDTGPRGPQVIVVHEGPGAATFMEKMATSDHPFDAWFRDMITEMHGLDFSQPMRGEMPRNFIDWTTGKKAREART